MTPKLPLPRGWKRRVRSSVLHILALSHYIFTGLMAEAAPVGIARFGQAQVDGSGIIGLTGKAHEAAANQGDVPRWADGICPSSRSTLRHNLETQVRVSVHPNEYVQEVRAGQDVRLGRKLGHLLTLGLFLGLGSKVRR